MKPIRVENLQGGLSTHEATGIEDNQMAAAKNFYYNNKLILTVRRGVVEFGNEIASVDNMHSIEFFELSDGSRHLLCGAGTKVYEFNESTLDWDEIKTGLTDGLPLCFYVYKDIMYWTNGTDNVMSYDGTTVAEHSGVQKGKYAIVANDIAYMAGVSTDASTVFYTAANPTDLKSSYANFEPINEDDGQIITALRALGPIVFVGKDASIYKLNVIGSPVEIDPIDYSGGVVSNRAWSNVENDLMHLSDEGVYKLSQRQATTGSFRAWPESNMIQSIIDSIKTKENSVSIYYPKERQMYLSYGTSSSNSDLLIWSVLNRAWTQYEGIAATDFTIYEDADGNKRLLCATPYGGQAYELETGLSDDDVGISFELSTKEFDFDEPETYKTFSYVDVMGFASKQQDFKISVIIDGEETSVNVSGSDYSESEVAHELPTGVYATGTYPTGGGVVEEGSVSMYPYIVRIPLYSTGRVIQVSISGEAKYSSLQVTKMTIFAEGQPVDFFPSAYIY